MTETGNALVELMQAVIRLRAADAAWEEMDTYGEALLGRKSIDDSRDLTEAECLLDKAMAHAEAVKK